MKRKHRSRRPTSPAHWYHGAGVTLSAIRCFARRVAERFRPQKIILFGSHAYGTPHGDSDVDVLVIMPARSQHEQAVRIRLAVPAPFPMDLLVRTPQNVRRRLAEGESFLTEVMAKGMILYEENHGGVGAESRGRFHRGPAKRSQQGALA